MISSAPVSATSKPLKSILKKSSSSNPPPASREGHHKQLALYHANLIQQRKDIENTIFESLEILIDFPSLATTDPAHPSESDAAEVKRLLEPFQPADLDSLIEERNINKKCGYVLCPRPHHQENTTGRFRLLVEGDGGHKDLKVVPIKDLEKWCSAECGKRMLYLRVQLSDTPAWERARSTSDELTFYGVESSRILAAGDDLAGVRSDLQRLALERGEHQPNEALGPVSVQVRERETPRHGDSMASEPGRGQQTVEGYLPRLVEGLAKATIATDSDDLADLL